MKLRELFVELGLEVDEESFRLGDNRITDLRNLLDLLADFARSAGQAFKTMVLDLAEAASQINNTSQALGVNAQALQELGYAAKLSGSSQEELVQGLTVLSRQLYEAGQGSEETAASFSKLGVSIRNADGTLRSADDVFIDLVGHFKNAKDDTERAALAMTFLGKSGSRLVPLLKQGSEELARLRGEAYRFGVVMDEDTVGAGAALGDSLDRTGMALMGLRNAIGGPLLQVLADVVDEFAEWVAANREWIATGLRQFIIGVVGAAKPFLAIARFLVTTTRMLAKDTNGFTKALRILAGIVGAAAAIMGIYTLGTAAMGVASAIATAGGILPMVAGFLALAVAEAAAAAPASLLGAALAGLIATIGLLAVSFYRFKTGKSSLIGELVEGFKQFWDSLEKKGTSLPVLNELLTVLQLIKLELKAIAELWDMLAPAWLKDAAAQMKPTTRSFAGTVLSAAPIPAAQLLGSYISYEGGDSPRASASSAARAQGGAQLLGSPISYGGGDSPRASAASASRAQGGATVNAPATFNMTVNASPGVDPQVLTGQVRDAVRDHHETVWRESGAALGVR